MNKVFASWRVAFGAAFVFSAAFAASSSQPGQPISEQPISEAEAALFTTPHLTQAGSETFTYKYLQFNKLKTLWTDTVEIRTGTNPPSIHCFSGTRYLAYISQMQSEIAGNPAILCFLEQEILSLNKQTGGRQIYFQKRIRKALADSATITPAQGVWEGRQWQGKSITITPFMDSAHEGQLESISRLTYTFILSDEVPGKLFKIIASLPHPNNKIEEVRMMYLARFERSRAHIN